MDADADADADSDTDTDTQTHRMIPDKVGHGRDGKCSSKQCNKLSTLCYTFNVIHISNITLATR